MMLDTNSLILALEQKYGALRTLVQTRRWSVSAVVRVETLGFARITPAEVTLFEAMFSLMEVVPVTDSVIERAITLRQMRKIGLGDCLIAATALVRDEELLTHNLDDFAWIPGLRVSDPLAAGDPA